MSDELENAKRQIRQDRKLMRRAEQTLAEIDRGPGLSDEHADVLAALRIRLEGKERASLEELLGTAGNISGKRQLNELLSSEEPDKSGDWPEIDEKPREWPGL